MDMKTKVMSILVVIFAMSTIALGATFFIGCKSLHPIFIKGQPDECNNFYTVMDFYVQVGKGQDSAFIGTVYNNCSQAQKDIRDTKKTNDCRDLWFGKDAILDKSKYDKYTGFLECISKK
jgi:hypothetical protein